MTFGEKLQGLRQKAGMSQDGLAEKLNVSRQAVSRWERDETMPEVEKIVALADLFGVTTDYLLRPEKSTPVKEAEVKTEHKTDWVDKLTHLAKTQGYLLGWVLIVWGATDLLGLLTTGLILNGFFKLSFLVDIDNIIQSTVVSPMTEVMTGVLWMPALYGLIKIIAGVLVLKYGKRYADKVKEEERL
jgi:transcriptional regulator with XRE-family HTH domain